jgi:hypothetical protein
MNPATALHLLNAVHFKVCHAAFNPKLVLLRVNRALAWALLISPVLQILWGSSLALGLLFDFLLLVLHGLLSLALFGMPKPAKAVAERRGAAYWLWPGASEGMSPRHRFLLTGWRVLLFTVLGGPMLFLGMVLAACMMFLPPLLLASPVLLALGLYLGALFIISFLSHISSATRYAYARLRVPAGEAYWLGHLTLLVFVFLSFYNLFGR